MEFIWIIALARIPNLEEAYFVPFSELEEFHNKYFDLNEMNSCLRSYLDFFEMLSGEFVEENHSDLS